MLSNLIQDIGLSLILSSDIGKQLLHIPVEDGAQICVDAQAENCLIVSRTVHFPAAGEAGEVVRTLASEVRTVGG
eukprot:scaffold263370_cov36-Tisochrysis_lutea.AAC.1